jgi:AcrR family transcriptional regulator
MLETPDSQRTPPGGDADGRREVANKHTARRLETHAGLLEAARQMIREGRLASCSIDELCQVASVSRAAFYLHFPHKTALIEVLVDEMHDWYVGQFRKFDAVTASSEDNIVNWLQHFMRGFEAAKHSILLFNSRGSGMPNLSARRRGEAVLLLGGQVPAFRQVRDDGSIDDERRLGVLLLIFQIEQLCLHLVLDRPGNEERALRVLARHIRAFMTPPASENETAG